MSTNPDAPWGICVGRREYDLGGRYARFTAVVGFVDGGGAGSLTVQVRGDDKIIRSIAVQAGPPVKVDLDISGARMLGLQISCQGVPGGSVAVGDPRLYGR